MNPPPEASDAVALAARIDHTLLAAEATRPRVHQLVAEATRWGFASVCVNGIFVADAAKALHGRGVAVCAVAGFPLGAGKPTVTAIECGAAVKDGATEVDFVAFLPHLLARDVEAARAAWREIVRAARASNPRVVVKVIVESAVLMRDVGDDEAEASIAAACRAARESGCDFIKTSTGFHPAGGATTAAVGLMKKHSEGLYVKAAGGIRTLADARAMLAAGADRLGCSASVAIVEAARRSLTAR
jgi:deoxyribose-phosphate aldolase